MTHDLIWCGLFHCWGCDTHLPLKDTPYCNKCKNQGKLDNFINNDNVTNTMTDFITTELASKMRSGINVAGEVTRKGDPRTVNLKSGGTVDVCDAVLSDESGDITLQLWGEDIAAVQVGSKVKILNGYTNEFKGQVSLTKGKFGTMEVE